MRIVIDLHQKLLPVNCSHVWRFCDSFFSRLRIF